MSSDFSDKKAPFAPPRKREVRFDRDPFAPSTRAPASRSPFPSSRPPPSFASSRPRASTEREPRRARPPPPPPATPDEIARLARQTRVPLRIARAAIEGGLSTEKWRGQNAAEAGRFDRVYALMDSDLGMSLEAAMNFEQRGVTVESLRVEKAERIASERLRELDVKIAEARKATPNTAVEAFRKKCIDGEVELGVVLGDRVLTDRLVSVEKTSLQFAEAGAVPALDLVMMAPSKTWQTVRSKARGDEALLKAPAAVPTQPARRAAADPRPFLEHVGKPLTFTLRNGIILSLKLAAVGPYDLIVGDARSQILVPLHALVAWAPKA